MAAALATLPLAGKSSPRLADRAMNGIWIAARHFDKEKGLAENPGRPAPGAASGPLQPHYDDL
jgi:hypothetical protein